MQKTGIDNGLSLTMEDVILLRGKPVVKKVDHHGGVLRQTSEEWVYVHGRGSGEEHYFFKNGFLCGYKAG